ncbi:MAG TPA: tol-pal system protein YbgF [Moraxellaceae bacterium]|nr:tol-pal system protein YbgF [Moraxellaceae bacterium]
MIRFRLATLTSLLVAASLARADIPVEDRPLTAPSPRPAQLAGGSSAAPTGAATAASAGAAATGAEGGSMWQQYTQVEQLQQQIQQLQGLVEQQGFLIEKMQNDLRARYTDLDQRLNAQQELIQQQQQAAAAAAAAASNPAAAGAAGASSPTLEEEKRAYLAAYDTFRVGGPDKAIPPMLAFVKRYPNSTYAPSAHYWLGEFYLNAAAPDQDAAQKQFDIVLANYPDSPKAPAALYKSGAILDLRGKPMEAKKRMQELLQKFPKSPEAALAQNYIDALESASKPVAEEPKAKPASQPASKAGSAKTSTSTSKSGKTAKASKDKKAAQTTSRKKN